MPHGGRSVACFFYYHSTTFLGLARCDYKLMNDEHGRPKLLKDWQFPSEQQQMEHARKCRRLLAPPTTGSESNRDD
jgi:hypothetical protein